MNFNHTEQVQTQLASISPDLKPLWGIMTPQHMVEHLILSIQISTGKGPQKLYSEERMANIIKQKVIYTETELGQGIQNPILGDQLSALVHANMHEAIAELINEIQYFEDYYKNNPDATHMQPRMGLLNHDEWVVLHDKHFKHHFKQFGLLEMES